MRLVAVVMLAGCLRSPEFAGGDAGTEPFDRCTYHDDDPLRYAAVATVAGPLSWDVARAACIRRGMDLAVMNDPRELGSIDGDQWPAWVGISQASASAPWIAVDGCPAPSPTNVSTGSACGFIATANDLAGTPCDGATPSPGGDMITRALCETPHPDSAGCTRDPRTESYVASPTPLTYAAAVAYCQGQAAHLVVIDSRDELQILAGLVPAVVSLDFWIGEKWDGAIWHSETACPGEFSWVDGDVATATLGSGESCTAAVVQSASGGDPDSPSGFVLLGQALAACDEMKIALCEQD